MLRETTVKPIRGSLKYLWSCLLVACSLATVAPVHGQNLAFSCQQNGASRSVEVVTGQDFACRVKYTKSGGTTYPWTARFEADYCAPKALDLVEKLKSWGWSCDSGEAPSSALKAHLERYHRQLKILSNIGKTCHFYPAEVKFGNLCGDTHEEGAVIYSCEINTDHWDQHLAVFVETENDPLILEVGSSTTREVTSYRFDKLRLILETRPIATQMADSQASSTPQTVSVECLAASASAWELFER